MKKVLSLFLSVLMLTSVVAAVDLSAYAATSGDYTYTVLDDGTAEITYYGGSETEVTIPSTLDGYTVTSIGYEAFKNCKSLTSITIPDSVTSIGNFAFRSCTSLVSISIPKSVTSIGKDVLLYCSDSTNVYYAGSEGEWNKFGLNLSNNAVLYLANIIYGEYVNWEFDSESGTFTLSGTGEMDNYTPANKQYVSYSGAYRVPWFSYLDDIKKVVIENGVQNIGDNAFDSCENLTSVTIPNSVTSIGERAFCGCGKLTNVTIPSSVTSIGERAFASCTSFTSVTIPNGVTRINNLTFAWCENLASVTIGSGVTYIGEQAFDSCTSLTSITIPSGVETIGKWAFDSCSSLNYINFTGTKSKWNGISINETGNGVLSCVTIHCSDGDITQSHTWNVTEKAGCESNGSQTCTVCGAVESIPSLGGHTWDKGTVIKAATCSSMGTMKYTCTACGATKTGNIATTSHKYKNVVTKATTSKNGKITPTCSVCGATKSSTTTIYKIKSMSLSTSSYTYNGKAKKPTVKVKDSKGKTIDSKYYKVTYINQSTGKTVSSMKNPGKYYVKVTFKTRYSGSIKKTVTIKPKKTSIKSIKASKKGFTVKWGKVSTQNTGYQVQYSTSKSFKSAKTATISKTGTTSKKVTKLKAKKKYYVRVRTYKTVKINGKNTKIYSSWSSAKGVTTKK